MREKSLKRQQKAQGLATPGPFFGSFAGVPSLLVVLAFLPWYIFMVVTIIGIPFAIMSGRRLFYVFKRDLAFTKEDEVKSKLDWLWLAMCFHLYPLFVIQGFFYVVLIFPFVMLLGSFIGAFEALFYVCQYGKKPERFKQSFKQSSAYLLRCMLWALAPFWSPRENCANELKEPHPLNIHLASFIAVVFVAKEVIIPLVNSATDISYTVQLITEAKEISLPGQPSLLSTSYAAAFSTAFGIFITLVIVSRFVILTVLYAPAMTLRRFFIAYSGFRARDLTPAAAKEAGLASTSQLELEKSPSSTPEARLEGGDVSDDGVAEVHHHGPSKFDERLSIGLLRLVGTFAQDVIQLVVSCTTVGYLTGFSASWLVNVVFSVISLSLRWADYIVRAVFSRVIRGPLRLVLKVFITLTFMSLLAVLVLVAALGVIPGSDFCNSGKLLTLENMNYFDQCQQLTFPLYMLNTTAPGAVSLSNLTSLPPTFFQNNTGLTAITLRTATVFSFNPPYLVFEVAGNAVLATVELDVEHFVSASDNFTGNITGNPKLSSLSFPRLQAFANGTNLAHSGSPTEMALEISFNGDLTSLIFPSMTTFVSATGLPQPDSFTVGLLVRNNTALTEVSLPALTSLSELPGVSIVIYLVGNPLLQTVTFGGSPVSCTIAGGSISWVICGNALTALDLPCPALVNTC